MDIIYVEVKVGEYEGYRGVLNGIVHESKAQGTVVSVSVMAPPDYDGTPTEVYLPAKWVSQLV